jgi:hypothetical protein
LDSAPLIGRRQVRGSWFVGVFIQAALHHRASIMGRGGLPEEQGAQTLGAARAADMLSEGKVRSSGGGAALRAAGGGRWRRR